MDKIKTYKFAPDYVPPPGETLRETLEFLGMSQAELARRTDKPEKTISAIASGSSSITTETAIRLERVLGVPASLWLNLQRQYDEAEQQRKERADLETKLSWVKNFPLRNMIEYGWLRKCEDKVEQLNELLSFLGAASPKAWESNFQHMEASFRQPRHAKQNRYALGAWLRRGEAIAAHSTCNAYSESAFVQALSDARCLTLAPAERIGRDINRVCNPCGVVVVFVRELSGAPVSGATRWLTPRKALIQLSLRYKTDDQLWFSFFHEAGHILMHHKRGILLEDDGCAGPDEDEAHRFAADTLIPQAEWRSFTAGLRKPYISERAVRAFARSLGIAPGIVVGRLQHEGLLAHSKLNALKRKLKWRASEKGGD
ncbi:HigA family addiction module antidote protein [bacterium]|nr:HigA family addiction module antidote protein [bacterium]